MRPVPRPPRLAATTLGIAIAACAHAPDGLAPEAALVAAIDEIGLTTDAAVLVGTGDIASCERPDPPAATAALVRAVLERAPDALVFTTGDHAYPDGTPEEFEACYDPVWGEFNSRTVPTPGNHDYETEHAAGYFGYFEIFRERPEARRGGYYDLDIGAWRIVVLNSLLPLEPDSPQLAWVEQRLEAEPSRCLLATWHHPLRSSGFHGWLPWDRGRDTDVLWRPLSRHGVDVILNGHDHVYERFARLDADGRPDPDGARQFTVGTGGAELHPIVRQRRYSEYLTNETYGVLVLILRDDSYEWAYVGTDGVVHDRSAEPVPC